MQGPIRAGSVAAPRDCRAQPAWLRGHSLPDKSRDTTAEMCEARINRRAGSVTHDATAGANQLQRQDQDRLGIDTYHDKAAAHREPVDHRRHRLRIGNGCQRSSLTAEAVECRRHVFARIVSEMVNPEQARERLLVGAAPPGIQLQCATAFTRSYRELPDFTGIGAASEATNLPCGGSLDGRPGEAHDALACFW